MTSKEDIYQEYVDAMTKQQEAIEQLHQLQDTNLPVQSVMPGQPIAAVVPFTEEGLMTLEAAHDRVDAALERARQAQSNYARSRQQ